MIKFCISQFQIEGVPPTILTGNKAIDDHCMQSTLIGDVGEMTNMFRQKRLQEYFEITKLCEDNDVILSKQLLEKGNFLLVTSEFFTFIFISLLYKG